MLQINKFNVRVYGLLFNRAQQVLIEDTLIDGQKYTKFPGGGLEFGESTHDCIRREMMEETGSNVQIETHFYTTDIFQPSAFDDCSQVISIYYVVSSREVENIETSISKFDLDPMQGVNSSFRWVDIEKLMRERHFSLPLDRIVLSMMIDSGIPHTEPFLK